MAAVGNPFDGHRCPGGPLRRQLLPVRQPGPGHRGSRPGRGLFRPAAAAWAPTPTSTPQSSNPTGYNSWAVKTIETLPDGNENIIYSNAYGEQMLLVYQDTTTGQQWDTFYRV